MAQHCNDSVIFTTIVIGSPLYEVVGNLLGAHSDSYCELGTHVGGLGESGRGGAAAAA